MFWRRKREYSEEEIQLIKEYYREHPERFGTYNTSNIKEIKPFKPHRFYVVDRAIETAKKYAKEIESLKLEESKERDRLISNAKRYIKEMKSSETDPYRFYIVDRARQYLNNLDTESI